MHNSQPICTIKIDFHFPSALQFSNFRVSFNFKSYQIISNLLSLSKRHKNSEYRDTSTVRYEYLKLLLYFLFDILCYCFVFSFQLFFPFRYQFIIIIFARFWYVYLLYLLVCNQAKTICVHFNLYVHNLHSTLISYFLSASSLPFSFALSNAKWIFLLSLRKNVVRILTQFMS